MKLFVLVACCIGKICCFCCNIFLCAAIQNRMLDIRSGRIPLEWNCCSSRQRLGLIRFNLLIFRHPSINPNSSLSLRRRYLWRERSDTRVWLVPCIRDEIHKSQADKWFPICWHEYLQHCRFVFNHCTCGHGDSIATGCFVRLRCIGCYLLLFSQHAPYLCAKSEYYLLMEICL